MKASNIKDSLKRALKNFPPLWKSYSAFFAIRNKKLLKEYSRLSSDKRAWAHSPSGPAPTLSELTSQLATASQCLEPQYKDWCDQMRSPVKFHRKQWEFVFILEALKQNRMLKPNSTGLGFGCGREPLPALMVKNGCSIVATDLELSSARERGWVDTQEHAASLRDLNPLRIIPHSLFSEKVSFQSVDMNSIPDDLVGFDFLWSCCALEHLGSLRHGLDFILNAMHCLKPGGFAVHTTEFNLSSNTDTVDTEGLSLYRRRDLEYLSSALQAQGHKVFPFNFSAGELGIDNHFDLPPYKSFPHLKLKISEYVCTSVGVVIQKSPEVTGQV